MDRRPGVRASCGSPYGGRMRRRGAGSARVENFFLWIARNPLKSPESDERIQENPRKSKEIQAKFPWFCLVWLGPAGFRLERYGPRWAPAIASARLRYEDAPRSISIVRERRFCDQIMDNLRVIHRADFRVLA